MQLAHSKEKALVNTTIELWVP